MRDIARLVKRKQRLTERLTHRDNDRLDRGLELRSETWLRTRIHRLDVLLDRAGAFGG